MAYSLENTLVIPSGKMLYPTNSKLKNTIYVNSVTFLHQKMINLNSLFDFYCK